MYSNEDGNYVLQRACVKRRHTAEVFAWRKRKVIKGETFDGNRVLVENSRRLPACLQRWGRIVGRYERCEGSSCHRYRKIRKALQRRSALLQSLSSRHQASSY